jgi:hypothetical protein
VTDRLCFVSFCDEFAGEHSPDAADVQTDQQIEVILKLRDGFLSLEDIAKARQFLDEAKDSRITVEIDGFPERLLGVEEHDRYPVKSRFQ